MWRRLCPPMQSSYTGGTGRDWQRLPTRTAHGGGIRVVYAGRRARFAELL